MKQLSYFLILFLLLTRVGSLSAQSSDGSTANIFDELQRYDFGKGEIIVNQSMAIRNMVGVKNHGANVEVTDDKSFLKIPGYRMQVFSGNNQRVSKDEAFKKEEEIKEQFPDVPTYVTYSAPFWKLRVGDYRSHEEAYHMKLQLMKTFPSYGKEMYIVREDIRIPLD